VGRAPLRPTRRSALHSAADGTVEGAAPAAPGRAIPRGMRQGEPDTVRLVIMRLAIPLFLLLTLPATAWALDTDGDTLSDYQEIHKYLTDPTKVDSDGDEIPDGDLNERREYTYTVRAVIRVMRPVAKAFLSDDFQDARVLAETDEYVELEVVAYPFSTSGKTIEAHPRSVAKLSPREYTAPGVTTNHDEAMRKRVLRELDAAGIRPGETTDAELVRKVSTWLFGVSKHRNMFCTYFVGFRKGVPYVLPDCEQIFAVSKGSLDWSTEEQFAHELFGREMFDRKTYGHCTSAAVYLTTVLRAIGIPTRMILCIPVADASDPAQVAMVENGIGHPKVRAAILSGLKPGSTNFVSHTLNEVFVGGRWHRLNGTVLGDGILQPRYLGLFIRVHTFTDLAEAGLGETWGVRYATTGRSKAFPFSNPYRALVVDDLVGPYTEAPWAEGKEAVTSRAEHRKLTITRAYWARSVDPAPWFDHDELAARSGSGEIFLFHVKEWFPEQSYGQLKRFMDRADPVIILRADGHPDVPARLNGWFHTGTEPERREFEVFIKAPDLARMAPDIPYRLVPGNKSKLRWAVADGVRISRAK
jgi:Transglutaminase-like superfamily